MVNITLQGKAISVNRLYRGRRFLTPEGKQVKESNAWEAKAQYKKPPLTGKLGVDIKVYFNDKRRHDLDNILKAVLDSMTGILWEDDSQIDHIRITRMKGEERTELIVSPILDLSTD